MIISENKIRQRIVAGALIISFIIYNSSPLVFADEFITGVTPTSQGGHNVYNIEGQKFSGSTQFRQYDNFTLTEGNIANLIYKIGYDKFINLVNNQVNINGILNTMQGNNFYNGHAIFVSPNGIVIGASGILNVGSLSLITPSQSSYNSFLEKFNADKLSSYEFGSDKYKSLLADSSGNIVVNGKILARDEVNLYGKDVKIEGNTNNHAGIVSGWKDTATAFTDFDTAKTVFNSLVSNNIVDPTKFNLQNGKIVISAQSDSAAKVNVNNADLVASNKVDIKSTVKYSEQERRDNVKSEIKIENSNIKSKDVDIQALAVNEKIIKTLNPDSLVFIKNAVVDLFSPNYSLTSLWGTSGGAESNVTIANSVIQATHDVNILANAQSKTEQNINLLPPTAIILLKDAIVGNDGSIDTNQRANAKLAEYFSSGIFNGFEGPRTSSTVSIQQNTTINSGNDININSYADSSLTATSNLLGQVLPIGIYGVGTSTISSAIVNNSSLNSTRDTNVSVLSLNTNKIVMTSDSLLSMPVEDGAFAILLNNTTKTTTEAKLNHTTVNARNLDVSAINLSNSDVKVAMTAKVDKNVKHQGDTPSSAVSLVGILNRSQNNVTAEINNQSTITTTEDVDVVAQSLNTVKNSASGKIEDANATPPQNIFSNAKDKIKGFQTTYLNRSLFSRVKGKTDIEATGSSLIKAGGALVWNETTNNTNAKITNSTVSAGGDVNVQANTIDLTANSALTEANGKAKVGAGLGIIVNEEKNNTNAIIDNSDVYADNLDVKATTELPMNQGSITFGVKFPFKIFGVDKIQLGGNFVSEANAKWDLSFVYPLQDASFSSGVDFTGIADQNITTSVTDAILPKFRLTGFFNNFAQTTSSAEGLDVSASVIYNEVVNNTVANIKDSGNIYLDGNLNVNAVNSVIGYNAAGMIDILINQLNYKIPGQSDFVYKPQMDSGVFGVGANVIWDIYNNNATALVENSTITSTDGNVNVTSANEQAYITAIATGARSNSIGIDGSVNVQKLNGNTYSQILNNSEVTANNINVNAGKAKVETSGGVISLDKDTQKAELNAAREANDQITNINASGAWVSQYQEVDNNVQQDSSGGIAIGADVNYTTIERNIKALVENSTITSAQNTAINADTYSQTLNLAVAAAFSGGVKQKTDDIAKANNGINDSRVEHPNEDLIGNVFDNEDQHMQNPVGNVSNILGQFSLSGAGAVTINHDKTNVESGISKSTVNTGSGLDVISGKESRIINMSGGLGKSKKVGAGAALNFYRQSGKISSKIDDSTITYSKENAVLNINSDNTHKIIDIAIGAGVGSNAQAEAKGFRAAAGGSYTSNTITPTIEAIINNSTVNSTDDSKLITANVLANSQLTILDIAGGGAYLNGGTFGVGAGFATNYNDINNTINALVQNSTLRNVNDLSVVSLAQNNFTNVAVAGAMVNGTSSGYLFNGALNLDFIHNIMSSKIVNSDVLAAGDIDVSATSNTDNTNVAGTLNISTAEKGLGVNGDVIVNSQKNNITAEINNDNSKNIFADNVSVKAVSNELSSSTPIGVAVAAQNSMAAANVALNVISNTVNSLVKGNIYTINDVDVLAFDETTLRSRGATVALTGPDAIAVLGGTVNYDILNKTVNAKIYDSNIDAKDVTVDATSINSLGGTKNEQGKYNRDNFSDDNYEEKLLAKNNKGEYIGLKQDANFTNWNMFYDVSSGAHLAFAGAWLIKNVKNDIQAEITNSVINANNLDVVAQDYSIKNIISGAVSASGQVGIGASVLITKDNSNVYALITNGSDLNIEDKLNVRAKNTKDNIQVLAALGGGGTGYAGVNVLKNENTDKTVAKIDKLKMDEPVLPKNPTTAQQTEYNKKKQQWDNADSVTVKANKTNINAESDQNSTHVIVAGGGAGTVALAINPAINTYKSETIAGILNTTVEDSSIAVNANNNTKTRDIQAGVAGSGVVAGVGLVVNNDYADTIKATIDKSVIDTSRDVSVLSNSSLYSLNVLASVGVAIEGVSVVANVVKNHVLKETEASIKNSTIENSGNIEVVSNKGKQDKLINVSGGVAVAATGVSGTTGNIYNIYKNKTSADVISTAIDNGVSLDVEAYSDKIITNRNVGVSAGVVGAGILVDTLVNELDSTTTATIDVKNKQMFLTDDIKVLAGDKMQSSNTMVAVYGGAGFAGANVNFFESDNLVKAQILSETDGLISARNVDINSSSQIALGNTNVGVALGIGGLAGDVFGLGLGKRSDKYSTSEEKSNIKKAKEESKNLYDKTSQNGSDYYTPTTSPDNLKTGSIASSNANILATEDVNISAKSKIKGIDSDKLSLKNVNTSVGGVAIGVGIKGVKLNNNTLAETSGGEINAAGDVNLSSEFKNNVEIINTDVNVAGVSVAGSSALYVNSSDTTSKIANSTISADNVNVISNSDAKAELTGTSALVSGVSIGISVAEAADTNKTIALITGDTNIDASGAININATNNADLSSVLRTTIVSLVAPITYIKNTAEEKSITKAIIENVNGTIASNGINIIADSDLMNVNSRTNVVSVTGISAAAIGGAGATMDAELTAGIDSMNGLTIENSGQTQILTGVKHSDNTKASDIKATSKILSVNSSILGVYTGTEAKVTNKAKINAKLKTNEHKADSLVIKAMQNEVNDASLDSTVATLLGVSVAEITATANGDLKVDIAGNNTIANTANIYVNNTALNKVSMFSAIAALVSGLKTSLKSSMQTNTNVNLSGNFNSGSLTADINTNRNTDFDLTSRAGGIIGVGNLVLKNDIKGDSILTLSNLITDSNKKVNSMNLSNVATNKSNTITHQYSGGAIGVGAINYNVNFDTKTKLNLENSDINSLSDVSLNVKNNTLIADSSESSSEGIVAVSKNVYSQEYNSNAELNVKNSKIKGRNVNLKSAANVASTGDKHLTYYGKGGGFYASQKLDITNNIKENSKINIENSELRAKDKLKLEILTESKFKQQTNAKASGFIASPKNSNTLNVTGNNTLNIDNKSKLYSDSKVDINLDSKNDLEAKANAKSEHFGFKDPQAESYLAVSINNEINNNGVIEAGNDVDIDFMSNSTNNLTQYAHTEAQAAIPTSTEKGSLTKKVNNKLNINNGAKVISGNDIDITYSSGVGKESSEVSYESVCRVVFGIPITSKGNKSNFTSTHTRSLKLDGEIIAGNGNDRYMKINQDGSIDSSTYGFYDYDYILKNDGIADINSMKENNIASIQIDLKNTNDNIIEITETITSLNSKKSSLEQDYTSNKEITDYIKNLQNNGYTFKTVSEVNNIIQNKIKTSVTALGVSEETYNTILTNYNARLAEIEDINSQIYSGVREGEYINAPTISEFLNAHDYGLSSEQKSVMANAMNSEKALISTTDKGNFTTYNNQYILTNKIVTKDNQNIGEEYADILNTQKDIQSTIDSITTKIADNTQIKEELVVRKQSLESSLSKAKNDVIEDDANKKYSIVFYYVSPNSSTVKLNNIRNNEISGTGSIKTAASNFVIDNYSQRSIIFNGIDLNVSAQSGLFINGKDMQKVYRTGNPNPYSFKNNDKVISGVSAYYFIENFIGSSYESIPTTGVHYISSSKNNTPDGITVTNYFDASNPFVEGDIIPDIIFYDNIKSNSAFNIKNTSGNVIFDLDSITSNNLNLEALQGNVDITLKNNDAKLTLKSNDKIFAGKNINIKAKEVDIKGKLTTGYSDRAITITDSMLNNLVVDETTGQKNKINLGQNDNINAIYKDNQIYLYNVGQTGGNITITKKDGSNTTGVIDADITMAKGYQAISIDNKTSKQLNIANISNNLINGVFSSNGVTLKKGVTYVGYDSTNTIINSVGKLVLGEIINNGEGVLNIVANNGLDINQVLNNLNDVQDSIIASGETLIDIKNGDSDISGNISHTGNLNIIKDGYSSFKISSEIGNKNGNINITNKEYNKGIDFSGRIENQDGDVIISSLGGYNQTGKITNKNGLIKIINNYHGMASIYDSIINNNGDIVFETAGFDLNSNIEAVEGSVNISNPSWKFFTKDNSSIKAKTGISIYHGENNTNKLVINSYILNTGSGQISITNVNDNGIELRKSVTNKGGDIVILDAGKTVISSAVTSELGNITIDSNGIDINDAITAKEGDILISSINNYKQDAAIINNHGDTTISVTNGTTSINGYITNTNGNISILTDGSSANISSGVKTLSGTIEIENKKGNLTIADGAPVSATQGIIIKNTGNNLSIGSAINNSVSGDIELRSSNALTLTNTIKNQAGNILISSKDLGINNNISTGKGTISVSGSNSYNQNGDITNQEGHTVINAGGTSAKINGKVENTNGNIRIITNATTSNVKSAIETLNGTIEFENQKGDLTFTDTSEISATKGVNIKNTANILNISAPITNSDSGNIEISSNNGLSITKNIINQGKNVIVSNAAGNLALPGAITNSVGDIQISNSGDKLNVGGNIKNTGHITITQNGIGTSEIQSLIENIGAIDITNNSNSNLIIGNNISTKNGNINITSNGNSVISNKINTDFGNIVITSKGLTLNSAVAEKAGDITIKSTNGYTQNGSVTTDNGKIFISSSNGSNTINGDITTAEGNIEIETNSLNTQFDSNIKTSKGKIEIDNKKGNLEFKGAKKIEANKGILIQNSGSSQKLIINAELINDNQGIEISSKNGLDIKGSIYNEKGDLSIFNTNGDMTSASNIKNLDGEIFFANGGGKIDITGDIDNIGNFAITQKGVGVVTISGTLDNIGNVNIKNNSTSNLSITKAITNENGNIVISSNGNSIITNAISNNITDGTGNITITSNGLTVGNISTNKGELTLTSTNGYSQSGNIVNQDGNTTITSTNGSNVFVGDITNTKGNISITTNGSGANIASDIKTLDGTVSIENKQGDLILTDTSRVSATNGVSIKNTNNAQKLTICGTVSNENNDVVISSLKDLALSNTVTNETGDISISNNSGIASISGSIANNNGDITVSNGGNTIISASVSTNVGDVAITSNGLSVADISTNKGELTLTSTNGYSQSGNIVNGDGNTTITSTNGANVFVGDITNTKGNISITTDGSGANIASDIKTLAGTVSIENKQGDLILTDTSRVSATSGVSIKNTNNAQKLTIGGTVSNENNDVVISSLSGLVISNVITNGTGDISISNNSGIASISGSIANNNGDITVSNGGNTIISASVSTNVGDVAITSNGLSVADISTNKGEIKITSTNGYSQSGNILNGDGNTTITSTNGANVFVGDITNTKGNISITTNGSGANIASDIKTLAGTVSIENQKGDLELFIVSATDGITVKNNQTLNISEKLENTETGNISISNTGNTIILDSVSANIGDVTITSNGLTVGNISTNKGEIRITSTNGYSQSGNIVNQEGNTTITSTNGSNVFVGDITNTKGNISITTNGSGANIASDIKTLEGSVNIENKQGDLILTDTSRVSATNGVSIRNTNNAQKLTIGGTVSNENNDVVISSLKDLALSNTVTNETGDIDISSLSGLVISNVITNGTGDISISNNSGIASISGSIANNNGDITVSNGGNTIISASVSTNVGDVAITSNGLSVADISTNKGELTLTSTNGYSQSGNIVNQDGNTTITSTNGSNVFVGDITNTKGNISITTNGSGANIASDIKTLDGYVNIENQKGNLELSSVSATEGIVINNTGYQLNLNSKITNTNGNIEILSNNGIEGKDVISNANGNIKITNINNDLTISNEINNIQGNVTITNSGNKLTISGGINNNGLLNITQNGNNITSISGKIENSGNVSITNNSASNLVISNSIEAQNGAITVASKGNSIIYDNISTNIGDVTITSNGLSVADISTNKGEIKITSTNGYSQSGNIVNQDGNTTITSTNGSNVFVGDITNTKGNISITTNSNSTSINSSIKNIDGDITITNKKGNISLLSDSKIETKNGNINVSTVENSDNLITNGKIANTNSGNIVISTVNGSLVNGTVESAKGIINLSNTTNGSLQIGANITNNIGDTIISNTSSNGGIYITTSGQIHNINDKISLTNSGSNGIDIEGLIKTDVKDINITNSNSNIYIGEALSNNDKYITSGKDIIINQTNGSILNGTETNGYEHAYKTLLVSNGDLMLTVSDGDIGRTDAEKPGVSTKADTRVPDESINVKINGKITAKAENENKTDKRFINLRAKESDLNLYNVVSDGNIVLTAADMVQTGEPDAQGYAPYKSYSAKNAGDIGDYVISGQNVSIVASENIGEDGKNLTIIQDHLGNPDSRVYLEAYDSIYFDGRSNKVGEKLRIAQARTKGLGQIVLDLEDETNIENLIYGHTINVKQKGKDLIINNISMYGEHLDDDDSILPISEDARNAVGRQIILEAYDAYANNEGNSTITIKNADILGLGLKDENGNRLVDVKLVADNIIFESNATSDITKEPIVFEVRGVSEADVASVGGNRTNYNIKDGNYIANNVKINIDTNENNNHGVIFNSLYADNANVKTNMTSVNIKDAYITNNATIINGNVNASGYNYTAVISNDSKNLVPSDIQLYTRKTGNFSLSMDRSINIRTNAPVVHYNPHMLVNGYHSENSFVKIGLKENIIRQISKEIYKNIFASDLLFLKAKEVKIDTSNIIPEEITNYALPNDEKSESDINENLSSFFK